MCGSAAFVRWQFATAPPNTVRRRFGNPEPMKPGDRITVQGFLAKQPVQDGVRTATASTIALAGGPSLSVAGGNWTAQTLFFDPARSQCNQPPN